MAYVLGIDAGGTKTVELLADETGQVLEEARGGGANLQTDGELAVEKVFDSVMESLGKGRPISAVCLGIAGVDRPEDERVIRDILRRLGHRERALVVNDALIALVAGAPERVGMERAAHELALAARSVARQIAFDGQPYPLVLAGGAFKACPALADGLVGALELPGARSALLTVEPARGAVTLALDLLER